MGKGSGAAPAPGPRQLVYKMQLSSLGFPHTELTKALEGMTHPFKASGATPGGCARVHPPKDINLWKRK